MEWYMIIVYSILVIGGISSLLNYHLQKDWKMLWILTLDKEVKRRNMRHTLEYRIIKTASEEFVVQYRYRTKTWIFKDYSSWISLFDGTYPNIIRAKIRITRDREAKEHEATPNVVYSE